MFFVGVLIGGICTAILLILILKEHRTTALIGAVMSLIGLGGLIANYGWLMLPAFAVGVVASYLVAQWIYNRYQDTHYQEPPVLPKEIKNLSKKDYLYVNHCWYCGKEIDSRQDKKCPKCRRHYICSNCGNCWCDDPRNKKYN